LQQPRDLSTDSNAKVTDGPTRRHTGTNTDATPLSLC